MLEQTTLADIIRSKVPLGSQNSRGFFDVCCPLCNDRKARGGFKFDTETTGFSCYNCGAKMRYEEGSGKLSRNAREILAAFGITRDDLTAIRSTMFTNKVDDVEVNLEAMRKVKLITPEIQLPDRTYPLGVEHSFELQLPIAEYLEKRKIDIEVARIHFSTDQKLLRRAIIPFYRDGKLIYWQARSIDPDGKPRYLNSPVARDAVLYGYDVLFSMDTRPLFVTEGVFDAIVLNGICTLGSSLNEAKLEVLRRSKRRLIFVVDRDNTGGVFGTTAIENGWEISFVDERVGDANESVQVFGLPFTVFSLMKNATRDTMKLKLGVLMGKLRGA